MDLIYTELGKNSFYQVAEDVLLSELNKKLIKKKLMPLFLTKSVVFGKQNTEMFYFLMSENSAF
jgi:hypothetical protein